ncbi:GtrA family protein [Candidatus Leptofilum sp.]|uniref:GtrA family protein n=1 Tax=Candidatus Leptofilum sp. TaxID=3241576 RepID=UPI003B58BF14
MVSIFAGMAGRFGVNEKEAERFFKFAVVGVIGFIVDFGIFNLSLRPFELLLDNGTALHDFIVSLGLNDEQTVSLARTFASTLSFIAAIISNFMWNRYWTYPDSRSRSVRRQLAQFTVVSIAGILIRAPIIYFTSTPFTDLAATISALEPYSVRVGANLALVLAVIVVMFWNFFVNRYWTYNDVE